MKRHVLLVLVLLASGGCIVQNDSPIKVDGTFFPPLACAEATSFTLPSVAITGGTVDFAATSIYELMVIYESDLQPPTTGQGVPGSQYDNDFIVNQQQLTYQATYIPAGQLTGTAFTIPQDRQAMTWVIAAGANPANIGSGESAPALITDILGLNAVNTISQRLNVGDEVDVQVQIQLNGNLRSSSAIGVSSEPVTFPVQVFRSSFPGCPAGVVEIPDGPCALPGGQDGTVVGCCDSADGGALNAACPVE
jgi:hypothetical protein